MTLDPLPIPCDFYLFLANSIDSSTHMMHTDAQIIGDLEFCPPCWPIFGILSLKGSHPEDKTSFRSTKIIRNYLFPCNFSKFHLQLSILLYWEVFLLNIMHIRNICCLKIRFTLKKFHCSHDNCCGSVSHTNWFLMQ